VTWNFGLTFDERQKTEQDPKIPAMRADHYPSHWGAYPDMEEGERGGGY
jgi:hypothetical protein